MVPRRAAEERRCAAGVESDELRQAYNDGVHHVRGPRPARRDLAGGFGGGGWLTARGNGARRYRLGRDVTVIDTPGVRSFQPYGLQRRALRESFPEMVALADGCKVPPPPPSRTDWTRLVPPPVLTGHVSSLLLLRRRLQGAAAARRRRSGAVGSPSAARVPPPPCRERCAVPSRRDGAT